MLSIWALSTAGSGDYYQKDDYYFSSQADGPEGGLQWEGEGAKRLGLAGAAKVEDFRAVLEGRNPDPSGTPLSMAEKRGEVAPKPGWDLTFSAPKSVSLLGLVGGDERLLEAHEKAVSAALTYAEKNLAVTRVRTPEGGIERVATGNLLAAKTTHATSRHGDPQLHTHLIVANATWLEAAKAWRALESKALFEGQMTLGLIYQRELARQVMALGYDVQAHRAGTFEIAGVRAEQREQFSKSAARVEAAYEREKPSTAAAAQVVKLQDRPKKLPIDVGGLAARWQSEAREIGLDAQGLANAARESGPGREIAADRLPTRVAPIAEWVSELKSAFLGGAPEKYGYGPGEVGTGRDPEARRAVSFAVEVLEKRSAVFTKTEVMRAALEASPRHVATEGLEQEIGALEARGVLQSADRQLHGGLTTQEALATEAKLVAAMRAGLGRSIPAYTEIEAVERLKAPRSQADRIPLNAGQISAALLFLSSKDRVLAIQGSAGVGKTTLMRTVVEALAEKGVATVGFGPTHAAVAALTSEAGMEKAQTTASFLARLGEVADGARRVTSTERAEWTSKVAVVDEASMLSNADALKLVELSARLGLAKLVFLGDERQLGAVGPGAPFRHLLHQGAPKAVVDEIVRQRDQNLKGVVEALAKGQPRVGLEKLGLSLVEVGAGKGSTDLVARAFEIWRDAHDNGQSRPVLTATQAERRDVNDRVVSHLEQRGEIQRTAVTIAPLVQIHLIGPERWKRESYREGQVLVFTSASRQLDVLKDEQVRIAARGQKDTSTLLRVERLDGRKLILDLASLARNGRDVFSVYETKQPEPLFENARMVFERTLKDLDVRVGEGVRVLSADQSRIRLVRENGAQVELPAQDPRLRFLGPGYAATTHRAQGLTLNDDPIAILHSRNANQAMAYVQVSRAVHGISVVTDAKERLLSRLSQKDGLNLVAAENVRASRAESSVGRSSPGREFAHDQSVEAELEKEFERDRPRQSDRQIEEQLQAARSIALPGRGT